MCRAFAGNYKYLRPGFTLFFACIVLFSLLSVLSIQLYFNILFPLYRGYTYDTNSPATSPLCGFAVAKRLWHDCCSESLNLAGFARSDHQLTEIDQVGIQLYWLSERINFSMQLEESSFGLFRMARA